MRQAIVHGGSIDCPKGYDMSPCFFTTPADFPAMVMNQHDQLSLAYALSQVLAHRNRVLNIRRLQQGRGSIDLGTFRLLMVLPAMQ
jgi:hypothetical protein